MKILLCGDSHGNMNRLSNVINKAYEDFGVSSVIHVGDFGFYPSVFGSMRGKFPIPVYTIDGNHEDHTWLYECRRRNKSEKWPKKYNINYVSRGSVLKHGNATIGFIGGAFNVDRPQEGSVDKGTCNYLGPEEIENSLEEMNKYTIDLMVSHGCPGGIGIGIKGLPCFVPGADIFIHKPLGLEPYPLHDIGEHPLTEFYHGLLHKPKKWIFGHYHQVKQSYVGTTEFTCLGSSDGSDGYNFAHVFVFDTETKEVEFAGKIPHKE